MCLYVYLRLDKTILQKYIYFFYNEELIRIFAFPLDRYTHLCDQNRAHSTKVVQIDFSWHFLSLCWFCEIYFAQTILVIISEIKKTEMPIYILKLKLIPNERVVNESILQEFINLWSTVHEQGRRSLSHFLHQYIQRDKTWHIQSSWKCDRKTE